MPRAQTPGRVVRPRLLGLAAACTSFMALVAISLVTGPMNGHRGAPCALPRTDVHHSEGVDAWNPAYPRPRHRLDAVMVFLSFPDARPRTTPDQLVADYFPVTSRFFEHASYGLFRLRVHPLRTWLRMPGTSKSYGIARDWDPALRSAYVNDAIAAADRHVDFARYDVVYLVADPDAPGVDSDATKVINFDHPIRVDGTGLRRVVTVFEQHPPDRNVLAHETGHIFDLPDLYHRPGVGADDWDTYVGDWDLMGSQFGLAPEPFGWHRWKLGWLARNQVVCVERSGSTVHSLEPLAAPMTPGSRRGTRLLVVRTGLTTALGIEVRTAQGEDAGTCTEGVLVYRVRSAISSGRGPIQVLDGHPHSSACQVSSVYPPLANAPLKSGEGMTDPRSGVSIQVLGREATGRWRVRVIVP